MSNRHRCDRMSGKPAEHSREGVSVPFPVGTVGRDARTVLTAPDPLSVFVPSREDAEKCHKQKRHFRRSTRIFLSECLSRLPPAEHSVPDQLLKSIEGIPWQVCRHTRKDAISPSYAVHFLPTKHALWAAGRTPGCIEADPDNVFVKECDITPEWAGLGFTDALLFLREQHQDRGRRMSVSLEMTESRSDTDAIYFSHIPLLRFVDAFSGGAYGRALKTLLSPIVDRHLPASPASNTFCNTITTSNASSLPPLPPLPPSLSAAIIAAAEAFVGQPDNRMGLLQSLNGAICNAAPLSKEESLERCLFHLDQIVVALLKRCFLLEEDRLAMWASYRNDQEGLLCTMEQAARDDHSMHKQMTPMPTAEARAALDVDFPSFPQDDATLGRCTFARWKGQPHMIIPRAILASLPQQFPLDPPEKTACLSYYCSTRTDPSTLASCPIPDVRALESRLLHVTTTEQPLFPRGAAARPATGGTPSVACAPHGRSERLPRLKMLHAILLRLQLEADYRVIDAPESGTPGHAHLTEVPEDQFVVVTVRSLPLQFVISDDTEHGAYMVFNRLDPSHFEHISIRTLIDTCGAVPIHWKSTEQFIRVIEGAIAQQKKNPLQIYPADSRFPSPLDAFPAEGALELLRADFRTMAQHLMLSPEQLSETTVREIRSGSVILRYGGPSCGRTYLDRLANKLLPESDRQRPPAVTTKQWRHMLRKKALDLLDPLLFPPAS